MLFFSFVLWLYLFHLIKYKLLVFIMRAPPSPLQHYFSLLVQYQVPSASTYWIMATFILHVFNFQTSAFTLALGQPSNMLGRRPLQTSAKPPCWFPSRSLCSAAYSKHACGPRICLLLLWLERLWCSHFFLFPYLSAAILLSFVSSIHVVSWWRGCIPGVFIQHTQISEAFEHAKGIWELQ